MVNPLLKLARQSRAPSQPDEPEADSLLKKAGRGTLSGLAAVGNLLDVPGGAVRNALAGRNPLSPVLAPFSSDSRISGRDLLRKAGVVGRKDNWGNWGAGLAVEVATDPLTFLTGGLTKAGTVAKAAGVGGDVAQVASKAAGKSIGRRVAQFGTTIGDTVGTSTAKQSALEVAAKGAKTTVAEIGDKPFRESLFGYKVPFTNIEGPIKLGKWEQTAAKYLDDVENVVRYGKYSPVKHLTPLFSKAVKGATDKRGQVAARGMSEAGDAAEVLARDRFAPHVEAFEKSGVFDEARLVKSGMSATDARQAIIGRSNRILEYLENVGDKALPPELEPLRGTLDDMMKTPDDALEMLRKEGLNPAELKDPLIKYFARQRQSVDVPTFGASDQPAYTTKGGFDIAREDEYRDFVGGTAVLQKMSLDPKISGVAHAFPGGKLPKHVLDELTDYATKTYPEALKAEPMSVEQGLKTSVEKMRRSGMTPEQLAADDMAKQVQSALRSKDNAAGKLFGHWAKPTLEDTQGLDKIVSNMAESEAEMVGDGGMRKLVRAMAYQDPKRAKELTPLYKINPVEAGLARFSHAARTAATARGLRQLMVEVADLVDNIPVPKDAVPLLDVARNAGFTGDNAMELIAQELKSNPRFSGLLESRLGEGAVMPTTETVLKASDVAGLPARNAKELLTKYGKPGALMQEAFKPADYENIFRQIAIPREVADDIGRMMKAFTAPDEVNALVGALDSFTRLFKSGVTSIFPSFHTRNFGSGLAQNFLVGAADPNQFGPLKYLKPIKDMDSIMSGGVLDDAAKFPIIQQMGITDPAQATQALRRIMFSHGLTGPGQGYLGDAGDLVGSMAEQMPGLRPESLSVMKPGKSLLEIARQAAPTSLQEANPLNIAGVGATKDVFKPVAAGRNVAAYTESLVRGAGFIGFLRQGLDPTEAARRINLAQVDYRNLTPFERTVARRVVPFYAFSKGAMSNLFQTLWNRPGGRTGQTIRGINSLRSDDGPVPDYVGETAAIPLGKGPTGDSRYLTGLGLHMEDPLSFGGGGVQGMLLEAASRMNPALKAPAELATGQTFFQKGPEGGRPLGDLDPTIGRTISNLIGRDKPVTFPGSRAAEFVLGNSPASRLLTTARQLSEVSPLAKHPKGVGGVATNLLTGARVSHVSPAAQDAILREQIQRLLKQAGGKSFLRTYVPKEDAAAMSPQQREEVQQLQGLLDILAKRAKERKKR